jgi:hypothetical protein
MIWHRSEQNGRQGFSSQVVGCLQIGQVMVETLHRRKRACVNDRAD